MSGDGLSRRRFLQSAIALGGGAVLVRDIGRPDAALAGEPLAARDRILVVVELNGGLDGLNTLIPYSNPLYYQLRRGVAVPSSTALRLDGEVALNPALPLLRQRFDSGEVAIVRGVGQVDRDRSHFSCMQRVMSGSASPDTRTGWLGRYLDGAGFDGFGAVAIGTGELPLLLRAAHADSTVLPLDAGSLLGADRAATHDRLTVEALAALGAADFGIGEVANRAARAVSAAVGLAAQVMPAYQPQVLVSRPLVASLEMAARVVNLDVGARILHVRRYGFDTHSGQAGVDGALLGELDDAIETFFRALLPQYHSRVVLLTLTEFGRRAEANDSLGTDHGTSSVWFAVGSRVKGGLYGAQPPLSDLDERGDLRVYIDARSVAATVLSDWLGADDREVLEQSFPRLGFVSSDPVCEPGPITLSAGEDGYRSVQPSRLLDTRLGSGSPRRALGPGDVLDVQITGRGPVPADGVAAVVLNVTATAPTATSFLTVWPSGEPMPTVSSLNYVADQTVPNLVIVKLGTSGRISLFNESGSVEVIADVMGWFPSSGRYHAITPARLIDTRTDVPLPGGGIRTFQVAGRGGVPANAQAAVLNVTATDGTEGSYLTVWPAGEPQPNASSLNPRAGRAAPNLVLTKLSPQGAINVFNFAGLQHVIVDVFGWFAAASGFHALNPERILDTRARTGARGRLQPNRVIDIDARCRGGVPVNASAIALNVTVADTVGNGYLTVWPSGNPLPPTSNLNFADRDVVPNAVITQLGVSGMISFASAGGTAHVIADVVGWFE